MTESFTTATPPVVRGRNGRWTRRMSQVRTAIADGSLVVPDGEWIIFATDIPSHVGNKLAYNYRRSQPDFDWMCTVKNDVATVWCQPR